MNLADRATNMLTPGDFAPNYDPGVHPGFVPNFDLSAPPSAGYAESAFEGGYNLTSTASTPSPPSLFSDEVDTFIGPLRGGFPRAA